MPYAGTGSDGKAGAATDAENDRRGGRTSADNLGALCRRDHLLKTHGGFGLRQVAPGVFEWTTPTGHRYKERAHVFPVAQGRPPSEPPF